MLAGSRRRERVVDSWCSSVPLDSWSWLVIPGLSIAAKTTNHQPPHPPLTRQIELRLVVVVQHQIVILCSTAAGNLFAFRRRRGGHRLFAPAGFVDSAGSSEFPELIAIHLIFSHE
jgi:hypothetical protein